MDTVKLYWHSARMLIKSQLQYPASFLMQSFAQFVMQGTELAAVILIVDRFGMLRQWTGGEIMIFFAVVSMAFYLTEMFGRGLTGNFSALIRSGNLDTFLTRPRGILTQVLCHAVDPRRIGCLAVSAAAMVMGCRETGMQWTVLKAAACVEAVAFGMLLVMGLFLIEATVSIHSVKSVEAVNALTYGGLSTCQYPIDIYPQPLQILFLFIAPFALTVHAPVSYMLDKMLYGWPEWTAFVCPLAGGAFFGIMWAVFQYAMRHYRSTGS